MRKLRTLLTLGTRPEAIKMAPVVLECRARLDEVEAIVCLTGQHREMLAQVTDYFGIVAGIDLNLMTPGQTPAGVTARCLAALDQVLADTRPDCVVAQGDTSTVLATSLASFLHRIPFVHVEAGLRTGNLNAPWPEEFNRRVASAATSLHCAPTPRAAGQLIAEGYAPQAVHVTGNTVIDALRWATVREQGRDHLWQAKYAPLADRRCVLITGHRRENFGHSLENICRAIAELSDMHRDVVFIYPVHLNPNVREPVGRLLGGRHNVLLVEPAPYPEFVWLMNRSTLILTDSGGVQEEAPSLRKPVLVMRDTTERPEAVECGAAELVGADAERIVERVGSLLTDPADYAAHLVEASPYGDGHAAERIVDLMLAQGWQQRV